MRTILRVLMKFVAIGIFFLVHPTAISAQLFVDHEQYPGVKTIKGRYFNGTGGKGYWSLEHVDEVGRVVKKESYRRQKLLSRNVLRYDDHHNVLLEVETYSINDPSRIDTNRWEYQYQGDRIRFQYRKLSDHDSTVIKLVKNQDDTLLQYREEAHYYRPLTGVTDVFVTVYTLIYQRGRLIKKEEFDVNRNTRKITRYSYYDHGRIKRKQIERIPESADEPVYVGGPGSDDESYEYKLDDAGRVKKFYKIIGGRKYKIATYKYRRG